MNYLSDSLLYHFELENSVMMTLKHCFNWFFYWFLPSYVLPNLCSPVWSISKTKFALLERKLICNQTLMFSLKCAWLVRQNRELELFTLNMYFWSRVQGSYIPSTAGWRQGWEGDGGGGGGGDEAWTSTFPGTAGFVWVQYFNLSFSQAGSYWKHLLTKGIFVSY